MELRGQEHFRIDPGPIRQALEEYLLQHVRQIGQHMGQRLAHRLRVERPLDGGMALDREQLRLDIDDRVNLACDPQIRIVE